MGVRKDHRESVASGEVEEFRFRGESTGLEGYAYVMLPVEYSRPEYAGRRFPVVVMLTGYPGDAHALITSMHFPSLVHEGEISGRVQPTVYVLMRPTLVPPRDTECTDVPAGPQTESFFAQDLPQALAANYRVADDRAGWGIMGDSTGGYCAAKIAMRHFDRFTAAASLAGYFRALRDLTTGDLYGGSHAVRNDNDLLWRAQHLPAPPISLLVASTRVGEQSYPEARRFLALARPPMRVDSLLLSSGGHNFATFRRMLPATLGWMSARLKPE
jgi:hypothetical protein